MSNQIWRCPECETVNSGEKCIVCGEEKPKEIIRRQSAEIEHTASDKILETSSSKNSSGSKAFIWILIIVILVLLGIIIFKDKGSEDSNTVTMTTLAETGYSVTEEITITEAVKTEVVVTGTTQIEYEFNKDKFYSDLFFCINQERGKLGYDSLTYNDTLEKNCNTMRSDIVQGKYEKGKKKYTEDFNGSVKYYESEFNLKKYSSEYEAAEALLEYERKYYSDKWLKENYKYFAASMSENSDGTYCIVFFVAGEMK